jgi:hypothetical protein
MVMTTIPVLGWTAKIIDQHLTPAALSRVIKEKSKKSGNPENNSVSPPF